MTVNELVGKLALRASELADMRMDDLRAEYPEETDTREELVRLCREQHISRGKIIEAVLVEDFSLEFDQDIPNE